MLTQQDGTDSYLDLMVTITVSNSVICTYFMICRSMSSCKREHDSSHRHVLQKMLTQYYSMLSILCFYFLEIFREIIRIGRCKDATFINNTRNGDIRHIHSYLKHPNAPKVLHFKNNIHFKL